MTISNLARQPDLDMDLGPASTEVYASEAEWLAARRHGIGASEAAVVAGVSPWKSPLQLYCEKLELVEPDAGEREALQWGRLLEPVIADWYAEQTGRKLWTPGPYVLHRSREVPFVTASFDRLILGDPRGVGGVQIKTASAWKAEEWEDEPPLAYQVQCQHEMFVAGASWWSCAVLIGGQRFRWYDLERNDHFLKGLLAKEREFWHRLQQQDPPAPDASEASQELLRQLYPRETPGLVVNLPSQAVEWDRQRLEAKEQIKKWEADEAAAENLLKGAIAEAEAGVLPNGVMYTWKAHERKGYTVQATTVRALRRKAVGA
jgi:putative phage-type endonuclease